MSRPSVAQDSSTVSNLIPNPSFEKNLAGAVTGWKARAWHGEADGRWTIESPGRTGERCVSIRSETGSDAAWTTTVSVRSNSFYRLSGSVDQRGKTWAVALVNRHPSKEVICTVRMKETPLDGTHSATILAADSPDAFNDVEHPDRVVPKETQLTFKNGLVKLAPHSLNIVKIPVK